MLLEFTRASRAPSHLLLQNGGDSSLTRSVPGTALHESHAGGLRGIKGSAPAFVREVLVHVLVASCHQNMCLNLCIRICIM
jgi:hypothetical protein